MADSYDLWRDRFAEVMDPRFYSVEWLENEVTSGRARLWCNDDAAIVATIRRYPTGATEVHGLIAAGDLPMIKLLIRAAEAWGKSMGATFAGIDSRAGWTKALKDDGYVLYQTALRKEL